MNCKPGDLAYLKEASRARCNLCGGWLTVVDAGHTVVCAELEIDPRKGPTWLLEKPIAYSIFCCLGEDGELTHLRDAILRPIRDPGSDAVDEMVAKVGPAPMTLTEVLEVSHG